MGIIIANSPREGGMSADSASFLAPCASTKEFVGKLKAACDFVKERLGNQAAPDVALVLGSGLGGFAEKLVNTLVIPYSTIPFMVKTTVSGHSGNLLIGETAAGRRVLCFAGRVHAYEGIAMYEVT